MFLRARYYEELLFRRLFKALGDKGQTTNLLEAKYSYSETQNKPKTFLKVTFDDEATFNGSSINFSCESCTIKIMMTKYLYSASRNSSKALLKEPVWCSQEFLIGGGGSKIGQNRGVAEGVASPRNAIFPLMGGLNTRTPPTPWLRPWKGLCYEQCIFRGSFTIFIGEECDKKMFGHKNRYSAFQN
jgi:hypothetical protein